MACTLSTFNVLKRQDRKKNELKLRIALFNTFTCIKTVSSKLFVGSLKCRIFSGVL